MCPVIGIIAKTEIRAHMLMEVEPFSCGLVVDKIRAVSLPQHVACTLSPWAMGTGHRSRGQKQASGRLTILRHFHNTRSQRMQAAQAAGTGILSIYLGVLIQKLQVQIQYVCIISPDRTIPHLVPSYHPSEPMGPRDVVGTAPKGIPLFKRMRCRMEICMLRFNIFHSLNAKCVMKPLL